MVVLPHVNAYLLTCRFVRLPVLHGPLVRSNKVRVLCPGAGLGRLVFEVVCRGYACQGNEFSYFMLFVSNFILNMYVAAWVPSMILLCAGFCRRFQMMTVA